MLIKLWTSLYIEEAEMDTEDKRKQEFETKDNGMEELTLKQITYYLILLFYKTGKKYSCTQTKLGKLLSVLAFAYARRGELLFEEKIHEYPGGCGTLIPDLTFIPQTIYMRDFDSEDPDGIKTIDESFNEEVVIPEQYTKYGIISEEVKTSIEEVFRSFGAYSGSQLADCLNPIVKRIKKEGSKELSLERMRDIDIEDFTNNKIMEYICKNNP